MNSRKLHYNSSQLRAVAVNANTEVHIIPRGDGKTEGILAHKVVDLAHSMPRSLSVICHRDYESMLTKTLPPIIRGLEKLGYHRGYHYIIGKAAPQKWRKNGLWEMPVFPILKYEYFIHWYTGAGFLLVSFNRENSANGASGHAIINDEAKFLTGKYKQRFDEELSPAIRGSRELFGKCSQYLSKTFTTDQPTSSEAKWLFEYEKKMDKEVIDIILNINVKLSTLQQKLLQTTNPPTVQKLQKEIRKQKSDLNYFRQHAVFFHEPEPMANFEILGPERYRQWAEDLPSLIFRTSILNERLQEVQDGFYANLSEERHVVVWKDTRIEDVAHNENFHPDALVRNSCLHDSDVDLNRPLDLGFDWGDHINCLVVSQDWGDQYRFLKSMFIKKPKRVQDLVKAFCEYYKPHRAKHVNLPYDSTAYAGHGAHTTTYIDEVKKVLTKEGWTYTEYNLGRQMGYEYRYRLWANALSGTDPDIPDLVFNAHNCEYLLISMRQAPAKQGAKGIEKDKKSEKDRVNFPQEEATHFSEAADTILVYKLANALSTSIADLTPLYS